MAAEMNSKKQATTPRQAAQERNPIIPVPDLDESVPDLWHRAFDASPDLISIHDTQHRLIAVNRAMVDITGRSAEDLIGCHCYDVVHQTDCPLAICPHTLLLKDGQEHQVELYEKTLDTWLLVTVNPLYDKNQRLIGSIHIARNISAQKKDQQALRESEERFRQLSEATLDGVFLSDTSTIIQTNQVLADMLGYAPDELAGMSLFRLIAPHQRERLTHCLRTSRDGLHEFECIKQDGTRFPVQAHARAVTYKNKMVYQTAIRDITDQKKMEQDRATHERLQGVLQMAGAVCHEINQPMTAFYGYFDILARELSQDRHSVRKIRKIEKQMQRIEKIIHKLMHITQYKTKPYPGGEEIIDIDRSVVDKQ